MPKLTRAKVAGVLFCLSALGILASLTGLWVYRSLWPHPAAAAAASTVASAIALSFGLGAALLALAAFNPPELPARKRADRVWAAKAALEEAAHQYATLVMLTEELGAPSSEFVYYGLKNLNRALETALTSGLYTALSSLEQAEHVPEEDQLFQILLILHCDLAKELEQCEQHREGLWSNGIYLAVSSLYPRLARLKKDQLIQHIDGKLSAKPMEHLFKLSQHEQLLGFLRQIAVHLNQQNRCNQPLSATDLADICQQARIGIPCLSPVTRQVQSRAWLVGKTLDYLFEHSKRRNEVELRLPGGGRCKLMQQPAPSHSEPSNPETLKRYTFTLIHPPLEMNSGAGETIQLN